jgi:pimeloyl-ACP methyl ester carboxylesterase
LAEIDYSTALENLKIPTLIVWSEQDVMITAKDQELLKNPFRIAAQKHGTTVLYKTYRKISSLKKADPLPDLGHNLHWAAPTEIAKDIHAFVTGAEISNELSHSDMYNNIEGVSETSISVIRLK